MPSNIDIEFEARIEAHFTAGELCEFLDIDVLDILDAFPEAIQRFREAILEEVE
jgi:hypothetical protein